MLQVTLYQELSHLTTRCSKEDYSPTQTPTDTDWESTTSKSQSTVLIELELLITKETTWPITETPEATLTTSQIHMVDQRKIDLMPGPLSTSTPGLEDTL